MVTIRLFASFRDIAGAASLELPAGPDTTPGHLFARLAELHPALSRLGKSVLVAVNQEYARMDSPVQDGDEVAFFPPVSGG